MRLLTLVPLAALTLSTVACKKDPPPQDPPPPVVTTPPPPPQSTNATPVAVSMAPFLAPAITAAATLDTKGMKEEGTPFAGQFLEGQILEQNFQGEPGKCYTVVAMGGPGITEIDVTISVQPAPMLPATIIAQDNSTGPAVTVGGGGNCVKNAMPVGAPAKITLKVVRGSGYAAAQLFKK